VLCVPDPPTTNPRLKHACLPSVDDCLNWSTSDLCMGRCNGPAAVNDIDSEFQTRVCGLPDLSFRSEPVT